MGLIYAQQKSFFFAISGVNNFKGKMILMECLSELGAEQHEVKLEDLQRIYMLKRGVRLDKLVIFLLIKIRIIEKFLRK